MNHGEYKYSEQETSNPDTRGTDEDTQATLSVRSEPVTVSSM